MDFEKLFEQALDERWNEIEPLKKYITIDYIIGTFDTLDLEKRFEELKNDMAQAVIDELVEERRMEKFLERVI